MLRHILACALETLIPEGVSYKSKHYFTTKVSESGESGKLFVEPAGVAEGVTVIAYVQEGVITGGGGCC